MSTPKTAAQNKGSVWSRVEKHPLRTVVRETGQRGFEVVLPSGGGSSGSSSISMPGITETLSRTFWSNYNYREAQRNSDRETRRTAPVATGGRSRKKAGGWRALSDPYTRALSPFESNAPLDSRRSVWTTKKTSRFAGQARGKLTHTEVETYIKLIDVDASRANAPAASLKAHKKALEMAARVVKSNITRGGSGSGGGGNGVSVYSRAIIDSMRLAWNWQPVSAEWCVGDLVINRRTGEVEVGRFATMLDIVAVPVDSASNTLPGSSIILGELKTGYNKGMFELGTGMMTGGLGAVFDNSPLNQAKVQLVMGAMMFVRSYQLKWSQVKLYVIHCPTQENQTLTAYPVTKPEREFIARTLIAAGMLLPTPT